MALFSPLFASASFDSSAWLDDHLFVPLLRQTDNLARTLSDLPQSFGKSSHLFANFISNSFLNRLYLVPSPSPAVRSTTPWPTSSPTPFIESPSSSVPPPLPKIIPSPPKPVPAVSFVPNQSSGSFSPRQLNTLQSLFKRFLLESNQNNSSSPDSASSSPTTLAAVISDLQQLKNVINRSIPQNYSFGGAGSGGGSTTSTVGSTTAELQSGKANIDNVQIDGNTVTTTSGNLTLDSTGGTVAVSDHLTVSGTTTLSGAFSASTAASHSFTGDLDVSDDLTISGNFTVSGTTNFANTSSASKFYAQYGTAASPSFAFTTDQDTGLFRSAANQLGFSTLGAERLTINSSGNVGIGTTGPTDKLTVAHSNGNPVFTVGGSGNEGLLRLYANDAVTRLTINTNNNNAVSIESALGGGLSLEPAGGNVGIGNTSPETKLDVSGTASISLAYVGNGTAASPSFAFIVDQDTGVFRSAINQLGLSTLGVERLTINSSGNVGIGTTNVDAKFEVVGGVASISFTSQDGAVLKLTDSDGSCTHDPESSAETVSCSSDARLKSNIVEAPAVLDYLVNLPIRKFIVNASGEERTGVVAQELLTAGYGELVSTGDDGYYKVAAINPWKLVKGIQELNTKMEGEGLFKSIIGLFEKVFEVVFEKGLLKVANIITDKITTKELCLEEVCVTKEQLKALLQNSAVSMPTPSATPEPTPTSTPSPVSTPESTPAPDLIPEPIPTLTPELTPTSTPEPTPEVTPALVVPTSEPESESLKPALSEEL